MTASLTLAYVYDRCATSNQAMPVRRTRHSYPRVPACARGRY